MARAASLVVGLTVLHTSLASGQIDALAIRWFAIFGVVAGWYLSLVAVLRATRLLALADALAFIPMRRAVSGLLGLGITAALVTAPAQADETGEEPPVLEVITAPRQPLDGQPTRASTWTVAPGQHFWSIAETTVARALGRAPTDKEVARYWLKLIEANRSVLADRDNPDLLFSGQQLALPAA